MKGKEKCKRGHKDNRMLLKVCDFVFQDFFMSFHVCDEAAEDKLSLCQPVTSLCSQQETFVSKLLGLLVKSFFIRSSVIRTMTPFALQ